MAAAGQAKRQPGAKLSEEALRQLLRIHREALAMRHVPDSIAALEPARQGPPRPAPTGGRLWIDMTRLARERSSPNSIDRVALKLFRALSGHGEPASPAICVDGRWMQATLHRDADEAKVGSPLLSSANEAIRPRPGDRLLIPLLDLNLNPQQVLATEALRREGLEVVLTLHDLFPLSHPEWNSASEILKFDQWLRRWLAVTDRIWCTTRHVAGTLARWLAVFSSDEGTGDLRASMTRMRTIPVLVSPLGCDAFGAMPASVRHAATASIAAHREQAASAGPRTNTEGTRGTRFAVIENFSLPPSDAPTFLCIATLHPRKGVDTLLEAFERLWAAGEQVRLVLSGRALSEAQKRKFVLHPEAGKRLFYEGYLSDTRLREIAPRCSAMIVPSREEGFGLPVMEAAALGLPVIARDIPVFREIAGDRCFYFGESPDRDLARRIGEWLALPAESRQRYTTRGLAIGWQEAARRLRDKIEHDHRDFTMHVPAPATPTAQPPGPPSANGTTQ